MNRPFAAGFVLGLLGVLALAIGFAATNMRDVYLRRRIRVASGESRIVAVRNLSKQLRIGMSKADVKAVMGVMDNPDADDVWIWGDRSVSLVPRNDDHWWYTDYFDRAAYFVVFRHGHLVTPLLKRTGGDPWEALQQFAGLSMHEAEGTLGPRPVVIQSESSPGKAIPSNHRR